MIPIPSGTPEAGQIDLPRVWVKPYYGSFDGLRAVAVFAVFCSHYCRYSSDPLQFRHWGWMGVDLFFVLSGFLITGILYDSLDGPHFFRNFYVRRALRIFPIFYGFFFLLFLLTPVLHFRWRWSLLEYFFYIGNVTIPFYNVRINNPTEILISLRGQTPVLFANLGHLWSLCVEEQFYLLWPTVIWLVRDRRKLLKLCLALIVATVLVRSGLRVYLRPWISEFRFLFYWSTYTRCDTLLIGAAMALWLRGVKLSTQRLRRISLWLFLVPSLIFLPGLAWSQHLHPGEWFLSNPFLTTIGFTLLGLACAGIVLRSLDETGPMAWFLQLKWVRLFGTISYGFYFFHAVPEVMLDHVAVAHPRWSPYLPVLAFIAVTTLAAISFHFYEAPFLKLKGRLAPGHRSIPSGREGIDLGSQGSGADAVVAGL